MTHAARRAGWGRALGVSLLLAVLACAGSSHEAGGEGSAVASPTLGDLLDRAEQARAVGDLDTAIAAYRQALDRTPWNPRLRATLAAAYAERASRIRDREGLPGLVRAEGDLREALDLSPDDPLLERNLAVVLVDRAVAEVDPERADALREEARALDPEVASVAAEHRPDIERSLDLAYEIVEHGPIDLGIEQLEARHASHPEHAATTRLLAQALERNAILHAERGQHEESARLLDRAVALYAELASRGSASGGDAGLRGELERAHRNRIVAWLNASRPAEARGALDEAERAGFRFADLASELAKPGPR
jgi:tetratricopeptide (TPR) repeat protein